MEVRSQKSEACELLEAARGGALGVFAYGHGLVVGATVLDLDVIHGDAGAGDLVGAEQADGLGAGGGAGDVLEGDVLDGDLGGAAGGADLVGAVLHVNDDGVGGVLHLDVLVVDLGGGEHGGGVLVRLDPEAVARLLERAVLDVDVRDVLLVLVPPQAADADAVAGAAGDAGDVHLAGPGADGDAVVADADDGVDDGDPGRVAHVDAVRVGAVPGRRHRHVLDQHVLALEHVHVEELGVEQRDPGHLPVVHVVQHQRVGQDLAVVLLGARVLAPHGGALPVERSLAGDHQVVHAQDLDPVTLVLAQVRGRQQIAVHLDGHVALARAGEVERADEVVALGDEDRLLPGAAARRRPRLLHSLRAVRLAVAGGAQLGDVERPAGPGRCFRVAALLGRSGGALLRVLPSVRGADERQEEQGSHRIVCARHFYLS